MSNILITKPSTISSGLKESFTRHAALAAIHVNETYYTYKQLEEMASMIARPIVEQADADKKPIGIFANRNIYAFAGVFGALIAGRAYVPLNPNNPAERLSKIIDAASIDTVILAEEFSEAFGKLGSLFSGLNIICLDPGEAVRKLAKQLPQHHFIFPNRDTCVDELRIDVSPEDAAYILYTSGTTGVPKGILIKHKNANAMVNFMIGKYGFNTSDKHSNVHDLSFDFSVHDIFLCILSGGCLYVLPKSQLFSPVEYIKSKMLTVWSSVPSIAMMMSRLGALEPACLPSLRYSFFCGEALQVSTAQAWQEAARSSIIDNIYGPTEATVSITGYRYDEQTTPTICVNGLVPIGLPYEGHRTLLIDENGAPVTQGTIGELCLCGPQVASGYYKNSTETLKSFKALLKDSESVWYKTGDLARELPNGILVFMGRLDEQVKVNGYRIEILEVEKALREVTGNQMAVCIPVISDKKLGVTDAIHAYLEGDRSSFDNEAILQQLETKLPWYMIPTTIHVLGKLPLNSNGKINKKLLQELSVNGNEATVDETSLKSSKPGSHHSIEKEPSDQELNLRSNQTVDPRCYRCFKDLKEDKALRGLGLIRIVNHQGKDDFICHVCLGGF
jgi:amino acid adenylation domain-containing protein